MKEEEEVEIIFEPTPKEEEEEIEMIKVNPKNNTLSQSPKVQSQTPSPSSHLKLETIIEPVESIILEEEVQLDSNMAQYQHSNDYDDIIFEDKKVSTFMTPMD
jgi:hypothetical protein